MSSREPTQLRLIATIKRTIALVPGARRLKRRLLGQPPVPTAADGFRLPVARPSDRGPPPRASRERLAERYRTSPLAAEPDTFVLYRVIGNDLPPRHAHGQSLANLAFILEHEPNLPDCEKRFVVNRIVDTETEDAVLKVLHDARMRYLHIPFNREEYADAAWDVDGVPVEYAPWTARFGNLTSSEQGHALMRLYRHKNNSVMNNNGARNAALADGRRIAKWILPWDGNCFVTASAWEEITAGIRDAPEIPFFIVPMARVTDHSKLLGARFEPEAREEPQILFRRDAPIAFDPKHYYGRRPKVELLWRLGVPGPWDNWSLEPWDLPCPAYADEAGAFEYAGWVARLSSGQTHLENEAFDALRPDGLGTAFIDRGFARVDAIKSMLDGLDDDFAGVADLARTRFIDAPSEPPAVPMAHPLAERLRAAADEALGRGPYSVVDKRSLPPSRNRHDYWHPAPYFWPHPLRLPGLRYVWRDGRRLPGTSLYEPGSERYDRTRVQRLFDDTFMLTLAWRFLGDGHCADHAANLVRTWFLETETAMNPHLEYAQVRRGHNKNRGPGTGIIEFKDLYFFLDAVRLLESADRLSAGERRGLRDWFGRYLHWLRTSPQGISERAAKNNHGTYYDLQVASIAAYLGERRLVRETLRDSRSRILGQVDATGVQIEEMTRTNTAHYCCFGLQGWIHLAQLAETCGEDIWTFEGSDGRGIRKASQWLLSHAGKPWPHTQIEPFDDDRLYPIQHICAMRFPELSKPDTEQIRPTNEIKPVFHPHDGIMPFWQLGLKRIACPEPHAKNLADLQTARSRKARA